MADRMDPAFQHWLCRQLSLDALERHPHSVVGLWSDGVIAYFNPAWRRFADENGGQPAIERDWGVGANYFDAIPLALRPQYRSFLSTARGPSESLSPPSHVCECSSADLYRRFSMLVFPLAERRGTIIMYSLIVEMARAEISLQPSASFKSNYVRDDGIARQCANCGRIQHAACLNRWDDVPSWSASMAELTSHVVCDVCLQYYYLAGSGRLD